MNDSTTLVPFPQHLVPLPGSGLHLRERPRIAVAAPGEALGATVTDLLSRLHGVEPVLTTENDNDLRLVLTPAPTPPADDITPPQGLDPLDGDPGRERYQLEVTDNGATITAATPEGLFRGAVTFAQLLHHQDGALTAPALRITDGPAWHWRGLSLDVVRRFFTVDQVKHVIDLLALYKFNVLHLHLSDSQAWRLEIDGWPRLTDPSFWPGKPLADEGVRPYYTQADFQEIVAYAAARFVTVVPEIDVPGHVLAAVRAYPELQGTVTPAHELIAFLDPNADVVDRFVTDVVGQLARLAPGPYLHVGGDEAFGMPHDLYAQFAARMLEIVRATGKKVVGWQEIARSGTLTPDDLVQAWIGKGDEFNLDTARAKAPEKYWPLLEQVAETFAQAVHDVPTAVAANAPVLASASSHMYLDRRYAEDSVQQDQNELRTRVGADIYQPRTTRELFAWRPDALTEIPDGARIAGVEAAIWCETVRSFEDLTFLLLPRLPGIAEKAWTVQDTEWDDYRARISQHGDWWSRLGLDGYYRSADVF
ncbi:beta-N-acetylhexosaminidase [Actinomadura hibisca]|uniref:beta-N-acetylhexosaminidase n=1 Tax=Actinomadura hibisca TaxID=68565 RepID=UPI00082FB911|nr:family 20 glycosylhydrolase [Actinomadura hibisca]